MEQQHSFRSQLVEWLREIVPYSKLDIYARKTREGLDTSDHADRHANHVNYLIVTARHSYSISASPTYLGCIASTTFYRPGENWTRGNDLPDGKFCRETWDAIKNAIIRYELLKLVPESETKVSMAELPDASNGAPPSAKEEEYSKAHVALWAAKQRFARAERDMIGQNVAEVAMAPLDMSKVAEFHPTVVVG